MESQAPIIALDNIFPKVKDLEGIQQRQRDSDMVWFGKWLYSQALRDSKMKTQQTKAFELYQRLLNG